MPDLREPIADLEAEIETLSEAADRCRKIGMAAQGVIAIGGVLFLLLMTGFLPFGPTFVLALAAVLGGLALLGSNKRTWDETVAGIRELEARRAELIDALRLEAVAAGIAERRTGLSGPSTTPAGRSES